MPHPRAAPVGSNLRVFTTGRRAPGALRRRFVSGEGNVRAMLDRVRAVDVHLRADGERAEEPAAVRKGGQWRLLDGSVEG